MPHIFSSFVFCMLFSQLPTKTQTHAQVSNLVGKSSVSLSYNFQNKPILKIFTVGAIFSFLLPTVIGEIYAQASCTNEVKNQIQKDIDDLTILENAPTIQEMGQKSKQNFGAIKSKKTLTDLDGAKQQIIDFVKTKYKLDADVIYDYTAEFGNVQNDKKTIKTKATVHRLTDFKDGAIDNTTFDFDITFELKTKKLTFTEIDLIPNNTNPEDITFAKKLLEQNTLPNGNIKSNALGQSDENLAKLEKLKDENQAKSTKISPEQSHADLRKDKKPEYKEKKKKLQKDKDNANCSGIRASAGLWNQTYNRNAAVTYANNNWNQRNGGYANFDLSSNGGGGGGDCTNFASQVMQAGGYQNDASFYSERTDRRQFALVNHNTYSNNNGQKFYTSLSFRGVNDNKNYIKNLSYTSNYYYWKNWKANGSTYSGYPTLWEDMFHGNRVTNGDVVYLDKENDGNWDHTMIITDWYQSSKNGWLPKFSYHSTDKSNTKFEDIKGFYPTGNFVAIKLDSK